MMGFTCLPFLKAGDVSCRTLVGLLHFLFVFSFIKFVCLTSQSFIEKNKNNFKWKPNL